MTSPAPTDLPCLKSLADGCQLTVQVVPNAAKTEVAGLHDGALRVRVAAPPIEGRANLALLQWLARSLGLPRRAMSLVGGDTNRRKRVHLDCAANTVAPWLRAQLPGASGSPDG